MREDVEMRDLNLRILKLYEIIIKVYITFCLFNAFLGTYKIVRK